MNTMSAFYLLKISQFNVDWQQYLSFSVCHIITITAKLSANLGVTSSKIMLQNYIFEERGDFS